MQPQIADCQVTDILYRSPRTTVYRGIRHSDSRAVVIKALTSDFPNPRDLARLRLEFRVATRVQGPGVIDVLGLEPWGNNLALIEEQVDGAPLSPPPRDERHLEAFFTVAVSITAALARVHEQVVHGDVAPSNILWDPSARAVKLIDFGAASEIRSEHHAPTTDGLSDSSMPYMAPERSGRINRDLDHRTDLYSLGATFYELLTGVRPFEAHERAELIYCHVTRQPRPPHEVVPGIPVLLSRLVMRLMAKNPEDRYQTAKGLLADLEACQRRWSRTGRLDAFPLGQKDSDGRLRTVQRVCGRESEMQTLFTAFEEARRGASRLVMVSGAPGVGKTVLVNEIRRTIFRLGGFFIEGKFDQFQRHAPYAAMADAFRQLVTQMLSAPEERLTVLRTELRDALAPNGRLVLDLVPEMERVIGPQPEMAAANPVEEQNRFHVTMTALFTVLARAHRPLVVFLDDLHWSDEPTVALIETLMSDRSLGSLLLIGAYREHEVDGTHPLTRLLSASERQDLITRIDIPPLDRAAVDQLVADSLAMPPDRTTSLSAALFSRTGGNPLAVRELLGLAGREAVLWFDAAQGEWRWDVDRIAGTAEGDDVVDVLLGRLRELPSATQRWLQLASCLGNAFDLDTLAVVGETTRGAAARGLWEALREGFVQPMGEDYRLVSEDGLGVLDTADFDVRYQFRHDRVQQAAYALVPEHEVQALHLRIGCSLYAELPAVQRGERIIEIVRHLDIGAPLLETTAERLALAHMNLEAARKARASAAYGPALELLETARALLPPGAWRDSFELAYEIHHLGAACAYMTGCLDVADERVAELLTQARTPRERANVYSMQLQQLTVCNRMDEAVAAGLTGLRLLGISMSARPSELSIMGELASAKLALGRRKVADLENESVVTDPTVLLAMRILIDFIPPAYLTGNDRLFAVAVLKQVRLSLGHGVCAEAAAAYASYVVLLAGLGDLRNADAFAKLALRLTEKFNAVDSRCRNLVLCTLFGASWNSPWRDLRASFQEAVRAGLESGDLLFTTYACGWVHLWAPDVDIRTAFEEGRKYLAIIEKTDYQNARDAALLAQQFWANLLGRTVSEMSLSSEDFDENECRERMQEVRNVSGVGIDALYRIVLAVIYGREEAGFEVLDRSQRSVRALAGSPYMVDYCLYGFLACAANANNPRHGPRARRYMKSLLKKMRGWAAHAPDNFRQHALLMEAESARGTGDHSRAMWLFNEAVSAARTGLFPRYEALANERAARFFAEQGLCRVAATYLAEARYHYARWGATRKVAALNEDLQHLAESTGEGLGSSAGLVGTANEVDETRSMSRLADSQTIWRAAQALSEEVILEHLLERLMSTLRQGAGATRVSLLLRDDDGDQLLVQADSRDERPPQVMQRQPPDGADLPLSVIRYVLRSGEPLILSDARREASLMSDPYLRGNDTCSMLALPLTHRGQHLGVLYLENALTTHAFDGDCVFTLQMLASQAAISLQNAQLYDQVRRLADSFSRFVPREFLRSLGHTQPVDIRFGESVQKKMTVLFADIRRFTTLVERMSPNENIGFLNTYIEYMEPAILDHGGFIDSYIGDALMALFGGSPTRAVEAAVAMLRALEDFNTERASAGAVAVDIGIGLNTGQLTLGTIGGAERLKCGVIGDAVNVAARIESLTKRYRVRLLISGVTHRQLTDPLRRSTRLVDRVRVAGHDKPVELFEVFAADPPFLRDEKHSTLAQWEAAMDLYFAGRFAEAVPLLSDLRSSSTLEDDAVLKVHLARAQRYAQSPPRPDWNGVETLSKK